MQDIFVDEATAFHLTPLGAAIVEAMPDKAKLRRIRKRFDRLRECPASVLWPTADAVQSWYADRGFAVEGYLARGA